MFMCTVVFFSYLTQLKVSSFLTEKTKPLSSLLSPLSHLQGKIFVFKSPYKSPLTFVLPWGSPPGDRCISIGTIQKYLANPEKKNSESTSFR